MTVSDSALADMICEAWSAAIPTREEGGTRNERIARMPWPTAGGQALLDAWRARWTPDADDIGRAAASGRGFVARKAWGLLPDTLAWAPEIAAERARLLPGLVLVIADSNGRGHVEIPATEEEFSTVEAGAYCGCASSRLHELLGPPRWRWSLTGSWAQAWVGADLAAVRAALAGLARIPDETLEMCAVAPAGLPASG